MDNDLKQLLAGKSFATEAQYQWGASTLQVRGYLGMQVPPQHLISSARCIVLDKDKVLTITGQENELHVVPGGRCETGEAPLQTMVREVLEETGWTVISPRIVGFVHFHHLTKKPLGYRYPYPDFLQLIYAGSAGEYLPKKVVHDPYVMGSGFRPISHVTTAIAADQQAFLKHAVTLQS